MIQNIIGKCPVCNERLNATRLKCNSCSTIIENNFKLSKFDYLLNEQLYFIEVFLRCRGSIKEVEKELKISYPTVRAKLDEIIKIFESDEEELKRKNKENNKVLELLEKGEIDIEEALKKLNEK